MQKKFHVICWPFLTNFDPKLPSSTSTLKQQPHRLWIFFLPITFDSLQNETKFAQVSQWKARNKSRLQTNKQTTLSGFYVYSTRDVDMKSRIIAEPLGTKIEVFNNTLLYPFSEFSVQDQSHFYLSKFDRMLHTINNSSTLAIILIQNTNPIKKIKVAIFYF